MTLGEVEGKKILEEYHLPADKKEAVKSLARWIWENPELSLEEYRACQSQVDFLRGEVFWSPALIAAWKRLIGRNSPMAALLRQHLRFALNMTRSQSLGMPAGIT
ncbi:MAG TPA: hypothetical protein PKY10_02540 [Lentisphaeria bacterium]|nr:hypothetical protein [Lentisphaeria bacterium]